MVAADTLTLVLDDSFELVETITDLYQQGKKDLASATLSCTLPSIKTLTMTLLRRSLCIAEVG